MPTTSRVVSRRSLTLAPQPPGGRLAKGLEHTTCAATGCERPYAWCELHHRQPWSQGGKTDLAEALSSRSFDVGRIRVTPGRAYGVAVPAAWLRAHPLTETLLSKERDEWRKAGHPWKRA